jgi:Mg2+-importing ATPase
MPTPAVKTDSPFWQLPVTVLLEQVAASPDGLSSAEAAARLAQFGPNLIHGERKRALLLQFLTKFRNPLVIILLTASALSAVTGDAASFFIRPGIPRRTGGGTIAPVGGGTRTGAAGRQAP